MNYWPGNTIAKSTHTGFTRGLSDDPDAWKSFRTIGVHSRNSAATVERKRAAGTDPSTIHGLSRKPPQGAAIALTTSVAGLMREAMKTGPLGRHALAKAAGIEPKYVCQYMQYDIKHGRVVCRHQDKPVRYELGGSA